MVKINYNTRIFAVFTESLCIMELDIWWAKYAAYDAKL